MYFSFYEFYHLKVSNTSLRFPKINTNTLILIVHTLKYRGISDVSKIVTTRHSGMSSNLYALPLLAGKISRFMKYVRYFLYLINF